MPTHAVKQRLERCPSLPQAGVAATARARVSRAGNGAWDAPLACGRWHPAAAGAHAMLRGQDRLRASATAAIAAAAASALLDELETWPKPGLVSYVDTGSHTDMDAGTFCRSVAAIEPFFADLATAGASGAGMDELRRVGLEAEQAMLAATHGINTHRGAIFGLGLLCAAAGAALGSENAQPSAGARWSYAAAVLGAIVRQQWGSRILVGPIPIDSHGTNALRRFGAGGARAQAAGGFPLVLLVGLPALRLGRRLAPGDALAGRVQAFFALLSVADDTNLLHRGGAAGLGYARKAARSFLAEGGVGRPAWVDAAVATHRGFVSRRLSAGGCGDLLAATLFLDRLEAGLS
jgi:triphosphoribosyl-dephospho-CoA synthase